MYIMYIVYIYIYMCVCVWVCVCVRVSAYALSVSLYVCNIKSNQGTIKTYVYLCEAFTEL